MKIRVISYSKEAIPISENVEAVERKMCNIDIINISKESTKSEQVPRTSSEILERQEDRASKAEGHKQYQQKGIKITW